MKQNTTILPLLTYATRTYGGTSLGVKIFTKFAAETVKNV